MSESGQRPKSWRLKVMSALVRIADNGSTDRQEGKDHSTAEPQIRRLQGMPAESIRLFCLTGKSLLIFRNRVKPRNQKYFCSRLTQITSISITVSFRQEGRIARRHERGAGCGGRGSGRRCQGMAGRVDKARELTNGTQTDDAWPGEAFGGDGLLRTAKSCGSDAPMLASSLWRCANPTGS